MQPGLLLGHRASRAGDHHALLHIEFQRPEHLTGVVDVNPEQFGVWIAILEGGGKAGGEERVEAVKKDLGLCDLTAKEQRAVGSMDSDFGRLLALLGMNQPGGSMESSINSQCGPRCCTRLLRD